MARTEAALLGVVRPQIVTSSTVGDGESIVVQLWGDQDSSTVAAVAAELAPAVAHKGANVVVDLREVQFINAATVRVLAAAGDFLVAQSRTFALRSPPRCAQRILDICGLRELCEPEGT
ncbi:MAG TPA: STAS domain-containing protein [Acidimicrobiales bacterium]|nr:STAS domain-containing protein [Acidimicrobiales bacterium]